MSILLITQERVHIEIVHIFIFTVSQQSFIS